MFGFALAFVAGSAFAASEKQKEIVETATTKTIAMRFIYFHLSGRQTVAYESS